MRTKGYYIVFEGSAGQLSTIRGPYKHAETAGAVRRELEDCHYKDRENINLKIFHLEKDGEAPWESPGQPGG